MISALANEFDGKIYGINLPETAIDINTKNDKTGFSCDKYFNAELENIIYTRKIFKKSHVVQYVNFFPCEWENDHQYMSRLFDAAKKYNFGLGGPDTVPYKKNHMKNSYPFFHKNKDNIFIAIAVQAPDWTYINPKTKKNFTKIELHDFATHYLGANIIFWDIEVPENPY